MAKAKVKDTGIYRKTPKKRRPGVHAKTKQSKNKRARNYKKLNVGQG